MRYILDGSELPKHIRAALLQYGFTIQEEYSLFLPQSNLPEPAEDEPCFCPPNANFGIPVLLERMQQVRLFYVRSTAGYLHNAEFTIRLYDDYAFVIWSQHAKYMYFKMLIFELVRAIQAYKRGKVMLSMKSVIEPVRDGKVIPIEVVDEISYEEAVRRIGWHWKTSNCRRVE